MLTIYVHIHVISGCMQKHFCKALQSKFVNLQMPSQIVDLNNAENLWLDLLNCVFRPRNSSP